MLKILFTFAVFYSFISTTPVSSEVVSIEDPKDFKSPFKEELQRSLWLEKVKKEGDAIRKNEPERRKALAERMKALEYKKSPEQRARELWLKKMREGVN